MNEEDKKLIIQYLTGDKESLEILIKKYLKPIYNFVYHYLNNPFDSEDVTQEVFLKVWRNLKKFDLDKCFKAWLFTIAKNTCFDFFKKKRSIPLSFFENKDDLFIDLFSSSNEMINRLEAQEKIWPALKKLTVKDRFILKQYYKKGFNFREISEELGQSINTIKSRYRRTLAFLRKIVGEF